MFNFFKDKQQDGKSIEEILSTFTKLIVGLVNQSNSNASFNVKKDQFGIPVHILHNSICTVCPFY